MTTPTTLQRDLSVWQEAAANASIPVCREESAHFS